MTELTYIQDSKPAHTRLTARRDACHIRSDYVGMILPVLVI